MSKVKQKYINGGSMPDLPSLPDLPDLPDMDAGGLPDLDDILNPPKPILEQRIDFGESAEENSAMVDEVVMDEFSAIREGRKKQAEAVKLANDTEYWFAVYFQSREQKERFLEAMEWIKHGDKYLDGRWIAKQHGIELPPRPAPYKVGRLDKKLTELT